MQLAPFWHEHQDGKRRSGGTASQQHEQTAPADLGHDLCSRPGCKAGAKRAEHHQPAVGDRNTIWRIPQGYGLQPGHKTAGSPDTDQHAANGEEDDIVCRRKENCADDRSEHQQSLHAARSIAVEPDPGRQLQCGGRQKECGAQNPEIARRQLEFLGERLGNERR